MSVQSTVRERPGSAGRVRFQTSFLLAVSLLERWRQRKRSRQELRNLRLLDDHILQDIGLTGGALRREAEGPLRIGKQK